MKKKLIVIADTKKQEVAESLQQLKPWLAELVDVIGWYTDAQAFDVTVLPDYVITLGGDGLLLATARQLARQSRKTIPIIGVNFGKLGFLTEFTVWELYDELPKIVQGQHTIDARMMLQCQVERNGQVIYTSLALNDCVIKYPCMSRMLYTRILIDAEEITNFGGDGIIVATPVGSTAYSMAAGGPIVSHDLSAFIITPICPHMLTLRPLVVSSRQHIEIQFTPPYPYNPILTIDGQIDFGLEQHDHILISQADQNFYLARTGLRSFFRVLREKLVWGEARLNLRN